MALLMTFGMQRSSMVYLGTYARTNGIDRAWLVEVACILAHYTMLDRPPDDRVGPVCGHVDLYRDRVGRRDLPRARIRAGAHRLAGRQRSASRLAPSDRDDAQPGAAARGVHW